jgi:hypothetical protein
MTSNDSRGFRLAIMAATSIAGWQKPKGVSRETSDIRWIRPGLFHVKQMR